MNTDFHKRELRNLSRMRINKTVIRSAHFCLETNFCLTITMTDLGHYLDIPYSARDPQPTTTLKIDIFRQCSNTAMAAIHENFVCVDLSSLPFDNELQSDLILR